MTSAHPHMMMRNLLSLVCCLCVTSSVYFSFEAAHMENFLNGAVSQMVKSETKLNQSTKTIQLSTHDIDFWVTTSFRGEEFGRIMALVDSNFTIEWDEWLVWHLLRHNEVCFWLALFLGLFSFCSCIQTSNTTVGLTHANNSLWLFRDICYGEIKQDEFHRMVSSLLISIQRESWGPLSLWFCAKPALGHSRSKVRPWSVHHHHE